MYCQCFLYHSCLRVFWAHFCMEAMPHISIAAIRYTIAVRGYIFPNVIIEKARHTFGSSYMKRFLYGCAGNVNHLQLYSIYCSIDEFLSH